MSHAMMDPINVVSLSDPARSTGPTSGSNFGPGVVHAFSSITELDRALLLAGDTQRFLDTLGINDKLYRLRTYLADGTLTEEALLNSSLSGRALPDAVIEASTDPDDEVEPWGAIWVNEATPEVFQSNGDGTWTSKWDGS